MKVKKVLILLICGTIILSAGITGLLAVRQKPPSKVEVEPEPVQVRQALPKPAEVKPPEKKKVNLYSDSLYELPLYSIADINKLPPQVQKTVNALLEQAQGFYFLKYNQHDKSIEIILQNPIEEKRVYPRHQIQIARINLLGEVQYKDTGYSGVDGEINQNFEENNNDVWVFDTKSETQHPIEHISYDHNGNVIFTEKWNYNDEENVKYEQRDAHKNLISVIKETPNGEKYRKEHIFYNKDGHITGSMTINYEGANISDFNYYNSEQDEGITVINEYSGGVKTKESIYNGDYKLINTITAEYKDGVRTKITVLDNEGNEVEELLN